MALEPDIPLFAQQGVPDLPQDLTSPQAPDPSQLAAADPGLLSEEAARQQVLNKIASGEANSYNELYGGHQFSSFDDHPRVAIPITSGPNDGKMSTAAGRYQFLSSTWDDEAKRLGLSDFSPSSQDAAAWDLADRTYRGATGRSLLADAQQGNVNWPVLGGQWESLQGSKPGPGLAKAQWGGRQWQSASSQQPSSSASQGSTSDNTLEALTKLRLLQGVFPQHTLTPVTYDPWKYTPGGSSNA